MSRIVQLAEEIQRRPIGGLHRLSSALRRGRRRASAYSREVRERHIPIAVKLALVFSLLIASGMVILGILVGTNQSNMLKEQMHSFGRTVVLQVAESAKEPLLASDSLGLELITNNLNSQHDILGAAIFTFEGKQIAGAGAVPPPGLLSGTGIGRGQLRQDNINWLQRSSQHAPLELASFIAPIRFRDMGEAKDITVGYALLTFNRELLTAAQEDTAVAVTATITLMILLSTFASFHLGGHLTRPINDLMEASHAIARGDYHLRLTDERRNDELGVLMQSLKVMGEGLLRKEQVEEVFSRYVSPQVAKQAIKDLNSVENVELGGQHMVASVLFADIVGFTSMSENMEPKEISALLNEYFTQIAHAVHFCGGHIDKYMGDCAMIVFGVPEHYPDHAFRALACSWMILRLIERMNERRLGMNLPPVEFRIGANAGDVLAGNMGSADRMEYTVVGDTVNLASRLSHAGAPGEAIFSEMMRKMAGVSQRVSSSTHDHMEIRGKKEPVETHKLIEITDPFRVEIERRIDEIMRNLQPEEA